MQFCQQDRKKLIFILTFVIILFSYVLFVRRSSKRSGSVSGHGITEFDDQKGVECDEENVSKKAPRLGANDQQKIIQAMGQFERVMMTALKIRVFVSHGSLLGWYRECGTIPYAPDVDFSVDERYVGDEMEEALLDYPPEMTKYGIRLKHIIGELEDSRYYIFYVNETIRINLFVLYHNANGGFHNWEIVDTLNCLVRLNYEAIKLPLHICTGKIQGYEIHVPCEPEEWLRIQYGSDWRTPLRYGSDNFHENYFHVKEAKRFLNSDEMIKDIP